MRLGATPEEWIHFDVQLGLPRFLLPTVCNRHAQISPTSKLKKPGKIPSRYTRERLVVGFPDWSRHDSTDREIQQWMNDSDLGMCIRTGSDSVCAFDLDLEDAAVVAEIKVMISAETAGIVLPARIRANSPRQLLIFRTEGARFKQTIDLPCGVIEFLAKGQQFVACGEHESGYRYEWEGGLPDEIPFLTPAHIEAIMRAILILARGQQWTEPRVMREKSDQEDDHTVVDPVEGYLRAHHIVKGRACPSGAIPVRCPNEKNHGKTGDDTQTVYFRAGTGGFEQGHVSCMDAACAGKKDADFLKDWGYTEWVMLDGFEVIDGGGDSTPAILAGVAPIEGVGSPVLDHQRILTEHRGVAHGFDGNPSLTDSGMRDRFVRLLDGRARYVPERGVWIFWDGRWILDDAKAPLVMAHLGRLPRQIEGEAVRYIQSGMSTTKNVSIIMQWATKVQQKSQMDAIVALTELASGVRLPQAVLDAHPLRLGLHDGRVCLDLDLGVVRSTTREDLLTRSLGVATIEHADKAVRWTQFLDEVLQHDHELIAWIQRWCGYLLTSYTREHCLLFLYGSGRNGKSVFLSTLMSILGDYGMTVQSETLTDSHRQSGAASPDLARLAGVRLAVSSETSDGRAFAEATVKQLTGGDRISARFLNENIFEFTPQFKLMIAGNHKPLINGNDLGIWRRIHLVPFTRTFTEEEADQTLAHTLELERPAILGWMVDGARLWLDSGLGRTPARVTAATAAYRSEMDTMGEFFKDDCVLSDTLSVSSASLYTAYVQWCIKCNLRVPTRQAFGRRISERSEVVKDRNAKNHMVVGIGLKAELSSGFAYKAPDLQEITCDELL